MSHMESPSVDRFAFVTYVLTPSPPKGSSRYFHIPIPSLSHSFHRVLLSSFTCPKDFSFLCDSLATNIAFDFSLPVFFGGWWGEGSTDTNSTYLSCHPLCPDAPHASALSFLWGYSTGFGTLSSWVFSAFQSLFSFLISKML